MSKTSEAWDELQAAIINIPTRLSYKLTSSRMDVVLLTLFYEWTLSQNMIGLSNGLNALLAATGGIVSTGYIIAKTAEKPKKVVENAGGNTIPYVEPPKPSEPHYVKPPDATESSTNVSYMEPFIPADVYKNANAFLNWEVYEDLFKNLDITKFSPNIRMEFAKQIVEEGLNRLDLAWKDEILRAGWPKDVDVPAVSSDEIEGYDAAESFKKKVRDGIPGCEWLPQNASSIIAGYAKLIKTADTLWQLSDKPIDWTKVRSINDLARLGLAAVR